MVEVAPNASFESRVGTITVVADSYGFPSDEPAMCEVVVDQAGANFIRDDKIHIYDVDVKPRWPWSRLVDVDFRVATPTNGLPVTVTFFGQNHEGGDLVKGYPTIDRLTECGAKKGCRYGFPGMVLKHVRAAIPSSNRCCVTSLR